MKLSSKSQYGLKACYLLANSDSLLSATELEKQISVSSKYLEKIMRMLCGSNIIIAERGAQGGYRLARTPDKITVGEIVRTLEDNMEIVGCISAPCRKCPTGSVWRRLYDGINSVLDGITLQSMVDDFHSERVCFSSNSCKGDAE